MTDTKALVAAAALNKMFKGSHFSICTIDSVAAMLGVHPEKQAYDLLRPLHCVDWSAMPIELRNQVPVLIEQALAGGFTAFEVSIAPQGNQALQVIDATPQTRRPLLRRIFG